MPVRSSGIACNFALPLALGGCTAMRTQACQPGEEIAIADTLCFGTNRPGGVVSVAEWESSLATDVTPRVPQGISSWRASDQWRSASGALEHEASFVLLLVHPERAETDRAVREVMDLCRRRCGQEAVRRVRLPACTSFP